MAGDANHLRMRREHPRHPFKAAIGGHIVIIEKGDDIDAVWQGVQPGVALGAGSRLRPGDQRPVLWRHLGQIGQVLCRAQAPDHHRRRQRLAANMAQPQAEIVPPALAGDNDGNTRHEAPLGGLKTRPGPRTRADERAANRSANRGADGDVASAKQEMPNRAHQGNCGLIRNGGDGDIGRRAGLLTRP